MKNLMVLIGITCSLSTQSFADSVQKLAYFQENASVQAANRYAREVKDYENYARQKVLNWLVPFATEKAIELAKRLNEQVLNPQPTVTIVSEQYRYNPRVGRQPVSTSAELEIIMDYDNFVCHLKYREEDPGWYSIWDSECISSTGYKNSFDDYGRRRSYDRD